MSEPLRYDPYCRNCVSCEMDEWDDGKFVKWEDYARLKAENAVVKLGNAEWKATAIERLDELIANNSVICNLRDEVERLRSQIANSEWQPIATAPPPILPSGNILP